MSAANIDNPYAVNVTEAAEAVQQAAIALYDHGMHIPIMLWGDFGIGKTEGIARGARAAGAKLIVIHLMDREPTEISGLNWVVDGEVRRLAPSDLPINSKDKYVLCFDELPQAPVMNKNIAGRLIHERRAGDFHLGPNVYVCAAGNYPSNRAGTTPMPAQVNSRLTHYDVVVSHAQWLLVAAQRGAHPFVVSYIRRRADALHKCDPALRASPNPRAWMRVSDIENSGFSGQARAAAIIGSLGTEYGTDYLSLSTILKDMPDPHDVLKDPRHAPVPTDRAVLYTLCSSLAALAKPANMEALIAYTNRFVNDEEYQVMCIGEAKERNPAVKSAKAFRDFLLTARGQMLSA